MAEYFLASQTPVVELSVIGTDPAGRQTTILVGFKRYELEEAQERFQVYTEANKPTADLAALEKDGVTIDPSTWKEVDKQVREAIDVMLRDEVVYFRNVQLWGQVPNKPSEFKKAMLIADSRTYKDEALLGTGSCLDFLLDMHLRSALWRTALVTAMFSAISNLKLGKTAEVKN
jgi:hypothetical protein